MFGAIAGISALNPGGIEGGRVLQRLLKFEEVDVLADRERRGGEERESEEEEEKEANSGHGGGGGM